MSLETIVVALVGGLAGGAVGGLIIGAVQAWMGRAKGDRVRYFGRHGGAHQRFVIPPATSSVGMGSFDRFNQSAKRLLALAQDEAIRHNHNYIGTEHLLAGLLREGDTVAARALTSLGIDLAKVRTAMDLIVGRGDHTTSPSEITLSPRTKRVIEFAIDEARRMGQPHVGAEQILLGLIREGEGIASGVIQSLGVDLPTVRAKVLQQLAESGTPPPADYAAAPPPRGPRGGPFDRFSDRAKRVLALAQDEAVRMGHSYIGPEHLLLGIGRLREMSQPDEPMKRIFEELGLTLEQLRAELAKVIPPVEQETPPTEIILSPETKELFALVVEESGAEPILPEHLLLAIVRDEQSFGAQILARLGVTPERVRAVVGH